MIRVPTLQEIRKAREALGKMVVETPTIPWRGAAVADAFGAKTEIFLKLELFQVTGTFKPRGALTVMLNLPKDKLGKGVTAVSAGNHAIAVAYAAKALGVSAKIVMKKGANAFRMGIVKDLGAEIVLAEDFHKAFDLAEQLQNQEGRTFVHPFEGPYTFLGTATCGLEFAEQAPDLDAVIVAVGGGGLASGVACAFHRAQPKAKLYGVEPFGADTMYRSFQSGEPEEIPEIATIADSLGAPMSLPGGVELCRRFLAEVVRVEDKAMVEAMRFLFEHARLAVEPAGAAATAALMGPLKEKLAGKRVGIIVCGSNIAAQDFFALVDEKKDLR